MKTLLLKPAEFKSFTIGVGISVGILTFSFVINFFVETRDEIRNRTRKPVPISQHEQAYTEVRGMN